MASRELADRAVFVGSEGTLGIIVEATLKLEPRLPSRVGRISFATVDDATNAVVDIQREGVTLQCVELLDDQMIRAVNRASEPDRKNGSPALKELPTLFLKLQGADDAAIEASAKRLGASTSLPWLTQQFRSRGAMARRSTSLETMPKAKSFGTRVRSRCGPPSPTCRIGSDFDPPTLRSQFPSCLR